MIHRWFTHEHRRVLVRVSFSLLVPLVGVFTLLTTTPTTPHPAAAQGSNELEQMYGGWGSGGGLLEIVDVSSGETLTPSPSPSPSPNSKNPLIIIPGFMGSYLHEKSESNYTERWPGLVEGDKSRLSLGGDMPIPVPNILATDAIRKYSKFGQGSENVYEKLIQMLIGKGYKEYTTNLDGSTPQERCELSSKDITLFVFAYDWRKSVKTNAKLLKNYIACIRNIHGSGTKIDILAHSIGGLIGRRYILDHPSDHGVDKFITIGTPWLGAPKTILALETGELKGLTDGKFLWLLFPLITSQQLKPLVEFYPGGHELLPSRAYFLSQEYPFIEDGWDIDGDGQAHEDYTYDQFATMMDKRFASSKPGTTNRIFHTSDQDDLTKSSVQHCLIYGIQNKADTIGQVKAVGLPMFGRSATTFPYFKPKIVSGDGIVPILSAEPEKIGRQKVFKISGENNAVNHTALLENEEVHQAILDCLGSGQQYANIQADQPLQEAYYITMVGVSSAMVTDAFGRSTDTTGKLLGGYVPNISFDSLGNKSYILILPTDQTYTVTMSVGNDPVYLDLTKGTDIATTQAIRYQDLSFDAAGTAMIKITPQNIEDLLYDGDGDGIFEKTTAPSISVRGDQANDVDPPKVTIQKTEQQGKVLVTISAMDQGSGVKNLLYSLDNTTFQTYSQQLLLDPLTTPYLYAFAEDNVANRSGLVTYDLTKSSMLKLYIPLIVYNAGTPHIPTAPSNLQANALSSSEIELTWEDNATNEDRFEIHDGGMIIADVEANATSYTVTGLASGTYKCFTIRAVNSGGWSDWSHWTCATTM